MERQHLRGSESSDPDVVLSVCGELIVERQTFGEWAQAWPGSEIPEHLGRLCPGFVDVHCHGGGGHSFVTTDTDEARKAAEFHHSSGSTTVVASLVTAREEVLQAQIRALRPLVGEGVIAGIHLEGPFLASARCGAQDPRYLAAPDALMAHRLLDVAEGTVVMMTIAPELLGAHEVVEVLDEAGVRVAFGHTDADYATFRRALDAPQPRIVTHLGNGMAPMHHRAPGPVGAVLAALAENQDVYIELIADGRHVSDDFLALLHASSGGRGLMLVSDAMAAAGMPDGQYALGELDVLVRDGAARLANGGLAGSTSTLADIAGRAGRVLGGAVSQATATPADALGLAASGRLEAGARADLVVLDAARRVRKAMRRGQWLFS